MDGTTDDAVLVTSELVTNALRHGAGETITVDLHHQGNHVRITVFDADRGAVAVERHPALGGRGRGLQIVDELALAWGVEYYGNGKAVWAEVPFP